MTRLFESVSVQYVCVLLFFVVGVTSNMRARLQLFEVKNHLAARKIYCAIQSYTEFQVICLVATASAPKNDDAQTIKVQYSNNNTHRERKIADKIAMRKDKCSRYCHQHCSFLITNTHFSHLHYFIPPFLRSSFL